MQDSERDAKRRRTYLLSRSIVCVIVVGALGTLLWSPPNALLYTADIALRTYLVFLGTVMAHEAIHGHIGMTKTVNTWWGRIALIPSLVPYTNFQKTHHLHHAYTNIPDKDPDYFMKPRHPIEIPLRAFAISHQWYFWLKRHGRIDARHIRDLVLNYALIGVVFAVLLLAVGPWRVLWGILPAAMLVAIILWYPFALKTHEGHSTGPSWTRSHDYYGHLMYWLSLGLSMHRVHHEKPQLSWLELRSFVAPAPAGTWGGLILRRNVSNEPADSYHRQG